MSASRAERLERLRAIQGRRREMEEWRLAALQRRAETLEAEALELLRSLGERSPLAGFFLEAKAQRLRRTEADRAAVLAEAEGVRARAREAASAEKRLERIGAQALRGERAEAESRSLAEILDAHLAASRASLE